MILSHAEAAQAKAEAVVSAVLMTAPWWVQFLHDVISPIMSGIAAICGAIVGLHAVYRIIRVKLRRK